MTTTELPAPTALRITGTITTRQRDLLMRLLAEREYSPAWYAAIVAENGARGISKQAASSHISWLMTRDVRAGVFVPATPRQIQTLVRLITERDIEPLAGDELVALMADGRLPMAQASRAIELLLELPRRAHELPFEAGYYALELEDGTPERYHVHLYRGQVEVTVISVHGGRTNLPIGGAEARSIVADITTDPMGCAMYYAEVTGRCWVCNRLLTDDESVRTGIGPVCRKRRGM